MSETMTLAEVLRRGRQADPDGVMVIVSREACEKAADKIERMQKLLADAEDLLVRQREERLRLRRREFVLAQNLETGRYWSGAREDIPPRFEEVPRRPEGGDCTSVKEPK